jgi:hypothetical protein
LGVVIAFSPPPELTAECDVAVAAVVAGALDVDAVLEPLDEPQPATASARAKQAVATMQSPLLIGFRTLA